MNLLFTLADAELKSGLLLPDREELAFDDTLSEESDDERLRPSSARMSSRLTLRWGCVYVGGLAVSSISVNLDVMVMKVKYVMTGGLDYPETGIAIGVCSVFGVMCVVDTVVLSIFGNKNGSGGAAIGRGGIKIDDAPEVQNTRVAGRSGLLNR